MILNELNGYRNDDAFKRFFRIEKNIDSESIKDRRNLFTAFIGTLEKHGWKKIGLGAYGMVLAHPNYPYVAKIFYSEEGYLSFVGFCKDNESPYLPKFRGSPMTIDNKYYLIRMERLQPLSGKENYDAFRIIRKLTKSLYIGETDNFAEFQQMYGPDDYSYFIKNPGLIGVTQKIVRVAQQNNLLLDLHAENFMMRGDTIVFIDPFLG